MIRKIRYILIILKQQIHMFQLLEAWLIHGFDLKRNGIQSGEIDYLFSAFTDLNYEKRTLFCMF